MLSTMFRNLALLPLFVIIWGCSSDTPVPSPFGQCVTCHTMEHDEHHKLKCTSCHGGIDTADDKDRAHQGLEAYPSHPELAKNHCLPCHKEIVEKSISSLHFTLAKSINMFRLSFGANESLTTFLDTPVTTYPKEELGLADNLLRQRCFKCHLYDSGQNYQKTTHGQGCAACHFPIDTNKNNASHTFIPPTDDHCLSCHYGNYVGADYYGRFEHDFNVEYRTPYIAAGEQIRPYGVEYRQLSKDIHMEKGLLCIDCHSGTELMLGAVQPSCRGCHDKKLLEAGLPPRTSIEDDNFVLISSSGSKHHLPLLQHPAHQNNIDSISCQACHAQWSFDDREKNYIRIDADEFDSYSALTVQGNYEVEAILTNNFDFDKDELPIAMTDTLTGKSSTGIWMKGFVERRWEEVKLGRDERGKIVVVRPILDYALSWVNEDEDLIFDAIKPLDSTRKIQPYTPHTTGPAGIFYQARIQRFLATEKSAHSSQEDF